MENFLRGQQQQAEAGDQQTRLWAESAPHYDQRALEVLAAPPVAQADAESELAEIVGIIIDARQQAELRLGPEATAERIADVIREMAGEVRAGVEFGDLRPELLADAGDLETVRRYRYWVRGGGYVVPTE